MSIKSLFLTGFLLVSQTTFCDTAADQAQFDEYFQLVSDQNIGIDVIMSYIKSMSLDALNAKALSVGNLTALHRAVCYNRIAVVDLLVLKMSQEVIDARDVWGRTALHYAVDKHVEIVKFLLSRMSLNAIIIKDNYGKTALDCAIRWEKYDIADMIRVAIQQKSKKV